MFIEAGTLVAIYSPLPGDKTTYRNSDLGTFVLREQHCGPGTVERTIHIHHTDSHYDYLEPISEAGTWTSPRPRSRRARRRERTPSPPPLMSASDDESELEGEEAMRQCNLTDADQDDNGEVPEAGKGDRNSEEKEEDEEEEEEEEEGDPTRTDANALVPIGGPVDGGDEEDPQSLVDRRIMKYFSNPGALFGGEVIAVHPPDPPD